MILDTSAIVAVFGKEPGHERVRDLLEGADTLAIGAATLAELGIVLGARLTDDPWALVREFLHEFEVEVIPLTSTHASVAVEAWRRFGEGRHLARLNFGDCLAYATSRVAGRPLLCVGEDFPRTDLPLASP